MRCFKGSPLEKKAGPTGKLFSRSALISQPSSIRGVKSKLNAVQGRSLENILFTPRPIDHSVEHPRDRGLSSRVYSRVETTASGAAPAAISSQGTDDHKPKTPPPDLPSLLLDSRIIYIGMPLVPAVTELVIAELLYLQYKDRNKPINVYINSSGCSRADGETVGFETEATAIYDTMVYVGNEINTVGVGMAIGQACMLLSAGTKGKRFMLPHTTAMLHQPRVPPTGQRQACEIDIKWKEVQKQKGVYLDILSRTTGHSQEKLELDMARPKYMQPKDAIKYNVVDHCLDPADSKRVIDEVKSGETWDSEAGLRRV